MCTLDDYKAWELEKYPPAPTTEKEDIKLEHIPGLGLQEIENDPIVDILEYITKTKNMPLSNKQIVKIIQTLSS
jgi:hypothetical protein